MRGESLSSAEPNIKNFQDFMLVAKRMNFLWLIAATYLIVPAEEKLRDIVIKEKFPPERIIGIIPKVKTPIYYHQKDIMELKNEVGDRSLKEIEKNDKKLLQKLQEHVKKYSWIEIANFVGDSLTLERLCEQIKHIKEGSEVEETEYTNNKPISDRLKFAAQCMHDIGYIKEGGAEYFSIFSDKVRPFINAIAKRIGLNYNGLIHLSITEIDKALEGTLNNKEIRERVKRRTKKDEWALISDKHGKSILIEDKEDVKLLYNLMIPRADQSMKELMGQVGNKGKCTGNAKVIMNNREFYKMETGDILVTTMTTPDFVILMQKSGAIITDIGGLLSHASIVSREMNKPCVVGTKFATKIIKDGDLIEVDANKGIVKILKKANK
jgi:phosphoenolpyruvate synthase/pyruvate phosphate dikinase